LREKIIIVKAHMEGERIPVAILFTDIVESTSIADRLDPEDWREIIMAGQPFQNGSIE
jgi:class 3 adenylate cyclase